MRRADRRAGVILAWCAAALAGLTGALAGLEIDPVASIEAGRANGAALRWLWPAVAAGWLGLTAFWWLLRDAGPSTRPRTAIAIVLLLAVVPRVAVLLTHEPALSDDVYRYVFDGRNLAAGFNPYTIAPEDRVAPGDAPRWPGEARVAAAVNNPELTTIYLPTSQWVFGATGRLLGARAATVTSATRAFRAAMTLFEIGAIAVLLVLLLRQGISPWWGALYAWHPLAIIEVAGSGHQESIGMLLLVAAILWWTAAPRRVAGWTALLAAAALVKPVVIPIAPLLLRGRPLRAWAMSALYGLMVCLFIAYPLLLGAPGDPIGHLRETSTRFSLKWAHFGSVYEPLLWAIERVTPSWTNDPQEQVARGLCLGLLAGVIVSIYLRRRGPWLGAQLVLLAMVLFSPAAHPWYLLWALILAPMGRSRAVWIASLTITWGYAAWRYREGDDGALGWGVAPWLLAAAWIPVWIALYLDWKNPLEPSHERA